MQECDVIPDLITARALKPVKILMDYARPLIEESSSFKLLLLKGENAEDEVVEAREHYDFDVETFPSVTNPLASILLISNIRLKS